MKRLRLFIAVAALALGLLWFVDQRTVAPIKPAPPPRASAVLKLPSDAPQRAYLQITAINEDIIPALEPLHGRVSYDDDRTARISAPITGRVIAIPAHLGDSVRAGQLLVALDSPDFAQARADQQKSHSDLQLKNKAFAREIRLGRRISVGNRRGIPPR